MKKMRQITTWLLMIVIVILIPAMDINASSSGVATATTACVDGSCFEYGNIEAHDIGPPIETPPIGSRPRGGQ